MVERGTDPPPTTTKKMMERGTDAPPLEELMPKDQGTERGVQTDPPHDEMACPSQIEKHRGNTDVDLGPISVRVDILYERLAILEERFGSPREMATTEKSGKETVVPTTKVTRMKGKKRGKVPTTLPSVLAPTVRQSGTGVEHTPPFNTRGEKWIEVVGRKVGRRRTQIGISSSLPDSPTQPPRVRGAERVVRGSEQKAGPVQ